MTTQTMVVAVLAAIAALAEKGVAAMVLRPAKRWVRMMAPRIDDNWAAFVSKETPKSRHFLKSVCLLQARRH